MTADTRPAPPIPASVEEMARKLLIDLDALMGKPIHTGPMAEQAYQMILAALASQSAKLIEAERDRDEWRNRGGEALKQIDAMHCRALAAEAKLAKAEEALGPFAKAAMGVQAFDPDFPMDGAALRASFDWYDKAQDEPLKRHSVRRRDLETARQALADLQDKGGGA